MEIVCNQVRVAVAEAPVDAGNEALVRDACAQLPFDAGNGRVLKTELGAPRLAGEGKVPALSFSRSGERRWAAVAWADGLGVDVACPEEFAQPYPLDRVFGPDEISQLDGLGLIGYSGYALLWSLKEAAAKALGTGFNTVEPIELSAKELVPDGRTVRAVVQTPTGELPAVAVSAKECWLAVAVKRANEDSDA